MAALAEVLVIACASALVIAGLGKMFYQLKRHASQPLRPRQPWE